MATTSVSEGQPAPDIELPAHTGGTLSLSSLRGQWVVLYFYPADDTPGCTAEACSFRDHFEDFTDAGAAVIGISSDSIDKHQRFATKHQLPFTLLTDTDGAARAAFGVKRTLGLLPGRVTFVIDPAGIVRKVFSSQFQATKHIGEALAAIETGS